MIERLGITLIGITFSNLFGDDAVQLALPLDGPSTSAVDATIDSLRDRFGSSAVTRAVLLGRSGGSAFRCSPTDERTRSSGSAFGRYSRSSASAWWGGAGRSSATRAAAAGTVKASAGSSTGVTWSGGVLNQLFFRRQIT